LFRHYDGMRAALLEPMPAFEKDTSSTSASQSSPSIGMQDHTATNGVTSSDDMNLLGNFGSPTKNDVGSSLLDIIGAPSSQPAKSSDLAKTDNLLDLLEGLDFGSGPSVITNNNTMGLNNLLSSPPSLPSATQSSHNILDGLMSMNSGPSMTSASLSSSNNLDDIFGDLGGSLSTTPSAPPAASTLMVYDKDELRITFDFEKSGVANQVSIQIPSSS
jgi:hypothetical protein